MERDGIQPAVRAPVRDVGEVSGGSHDAAIVSFPELERVAGVGDDHVLIRM